MATEITGSSKMPSDNAAGQNGDSRASSDLHPATPPLPPNTQTRTVGVSDVQPAHGMKRQQ